MAPDLIAFRCDCLKSKAMSMLSFCYCTDLLWPVIRPRAAAVLLLALLSAAGCAKREEPVKRYPLSGKVVSADVSSSRVVIDHKAIPGFMDAMVSVSEPDIARADDSV